MAEKKTVRIHEKEFEFELFEKEGKTYAKTHIPLFGDVTVADFGGGAPRAVENLRARVSNILAAQQQDEEREARRRGDVEQAPQEASAKE